MDIWTEAIKEAYASAPADPILETIELRHSSWTSPVRLVRDTIDLSAKLESNAPVNPGETVTFTACWFSNDLPESSDKVPEVPIQIDGVSREIVQEIDNSMGTRSPVYVTIRHYLASRATSGPEYVLGGLSIRRVSCIDKTVTATAVFGDFINRAFPRDTFTVENCPGLEWS